MKDLFKDIDKRPLVVASLGGGERLVDSARRATKLGADLIEIRIDSLKPKERANIHEILSAVKEITPCPLIATARRSKEQGPEASASRLDESERTILFEKSLPLADWIDLEIEADETARRAMILARELGKIVILSYHDFKGIPSEGKVLKLRSEFKKRGGDVLKIAGMAKSDADVIQLLQMCRSAKNLKRTFIAMGELGRISRAAGFLFGSCLTYGYVNKPTAPGQLSVSEIVELCRLFYPSYRTTKKRSLD